MWTWTYALREEVASVSHRERRRAAAGLRLDDLVTAKLDAHRERLAISVAESGTGHLPGNDSSHDSKRKMRRETRALPSSTAIEMR